MTHELIKREYVHRGKILDLSRSRFMSEAKGEVEIEIVHHNGGAGTLPLFEDGNVAPGYCEERIFVYVARGLEPCEQNLDDDEEIEVVRMPFAEALARAQSGEIDDAKSIITILLAASFVRSEK